MTLFKFLNYGIYENNFLFVSLNIELDSNVDESLKSMTYFRTNIEHILLFHFKAIACEIQNISNMLYETYCIYFRPKTKIENLTYSYKNKIIGENVDN